MAKPSQWSCDYCKKPHKSESKADVCCRIEKEWEGERHSYIGRGSGRGIEWLYELFKWRLYMDGMITTPVQPPWDNPLFQEHRESK